MSLASYWKTIPLSIFVYHHVYHSSSMESKTLMATELSIFLYADFLLVHTPDRNSVTPTSRWRERNCVLCCFNSNIMAKTNLSYQSGPIWVLCRKYFWCWLQCQFASEQERQFFCLVCVQYLITNMWERINYRCTVQLCDRTTCVVGRKTKEDKCN